MRAIRHDLQMSPASSDQSASVARVEATASKAGSDLRQAVVQAAARVQEIIDVAERTAHEVRDDAEHQAEKYLALRRHEADRLVEARSAKLTGRIGALVKRLELMHSDARQLATELEAVLEEARRTPATIESEPGPPTEPSRAFDPAAKPPAAAGLRARLFERSRRGTAFDTQSERPVDALTPDTPEAADEQALLRATQMAVAGSDRGEIERVLQDELGIADPAPVVERVLGRG